MKQVVIKRLLKQEDYTLNQQFEDFSGFYGSKPILRRPYRGQTKGKSVCSASFQAILQDSTCPHTRIDGQEEES